MSETFRPEPGVVDVRAGSFTRLQIMRRPDAVDARTGQHSTGRSLIDGLAPNGSRADQIGMAYIIERKERFYAVAYDGADPRTGRERRRWHPAARSRIDAEAIAERLTATRLGERHRPNSALTVSGFLLEMWMPRRHRELRPSTARRYEWMIRNYINPAIGDHRLNALRPEHLNRLYVELIDHGGAGGRSLALKTVYDVHVVIRSALRDATRRHLVDRNVALDAHPPRATTRSRRSPEIWTATQLAHLLAQSAHLRLYPALHLAATTGLRRGDLAGLRRGDWQRTCHRLSIARSRQSVQGKTVEVPTKTAASRRCIDLDAGTEQVLERWRRRQTDDGHPIGPDNPIFTNTTGAAVHPESITQLFDRQVARLGLPRIRFHDLRNTHEERSEATRSARSHAPAVYRWLGTSLVHRRVRIESTQGAPSQDSARCL